MLAYCDYIASLIRQIKTRDTERLLADVSSVEWDMDENGVLLSTTKTLTVTDRYGKKYTITVEEVA